MQYFRLRYDFRNEALRRRVVDNLIALRKQLDEQIPSKDTDQNLLLATWNIRDLGKANRRGFGPRLAESHYYIAEILSRFDFVAVQEVNDLPEWEKIMDILGPSFDYIATDVTDTALGGNGERLTYLWDRRKVWFQKIAGEIVLPAKMLISRVPVPSADDDGLFAGKQFRRTPFSAGFQAGWFKFDICTVHIYYGSESGAQLAERIDEINQIAKYLGARADDAMEAGKAIILLGDFNIVHPEHDTMKALVNNGFRIPKALNRPTNIDKSKYYDQIAFQTRRNILEFVDRESTDPLKRNAGVFEIYESVFKEGDAAAYRDPIRASSPSRADDTDEQLDKHYRTWRTYQMSDHKPMWVRLQINDSAAYLDALR